MRRRDKCIEIKIVCVVMQRKRVGQNSYVVIGFSLEWANYVGKPGAGLLMFPAVRLFDASMSQNLVPLSWQRRHKEV